LDNQKYLLLKQRAYERKKESFERKLISDKEKRESTLTFAINEAKSMVRPDTWCSNHIDCFRCSMGETDEHIKKQFERWLYWRRLDIHLLTNPILNTGDRPDLMILFNNGYISGEEIKCSESIESLEAKAKRYPFPFEVIKT
jgi:hypothetical protein